MNFTSISKKNSVEKTKKSSTKNSKKGSKKNSSKSSKKNSKKNSRKGSKPRSSTSAKQSTAVYNRSTSKSSKIKKVINKLIAPFKKQSPPQLEEEPTKVHYEHPCRAILEMYNGCCYGKLPYSYETYSSPEVTTGPLDPEAREVSKQINKELRLIEQPLLANRQFDVGKAEVLRMTLKCMDPSKSELDDDQKRLVRENKFYHGNGNRIRIGPGSPNTLLSESSYLNRASIIVDNPTEKAEIWPTEKENLKILKNSSYDAATSKKLEHPSEERESTVTIKPFEYPDQQEVLHETTTTGQLEFQAQQESFHEATTTNQLKTLLDHRETSLLETATNKSLKYQDQQESPLELQEKADIIVKEKQKEAEISFDDTFTPPGTSYSKIIVQIESKKTPIINKTRHHDSDISFDDTPPPTPRTPFNSNNWLMKSPVTPISTYTTNPSPLKKTRVNEPKLESNKKPKDCKSGMINNNSIDSNINKPKGNKNNDESKDKPTKTTFIPVFQKPHNLKYKRKYQTTNQFPSYFFTNQRFTMHSSIDFVSALRLEPSPSVDYNLKAIKCGNRNS